MLAAVTGTSFLFFLLISLGEPTILSIGGVTETFLFTAGMAFTCLGATAGDCAKQGVARIRAKNSWIIFKGFPD